MDLAFRDARVHAIRPREVALEPPVGVPSGPIAAAGTGSPVEV